MTFIRKYCLIFIVFVTFNINAYAADSSAKNVLESTINNVLSIIKDPQYANAETKIQMRKKIENEVLNIFDFTEFSMRTVGARWKSFTAEQQNTFSNAFADLLIITYIDKIDGYNGEQIVYLGERSGQEGQRVEVQTQLTLKDGKKIPVSYRMLPKNNTWKVYDVIIENLSLVKNYRTQFQDILNTATADQLIARVNAKAKEVREQNAKKQ